MPTRIAFLTLGMAAFFASPIGAQADFISTTFGTATADNSWSYFRAVGVGKGNRPSYVPLHSDYAGMEIFEGLVSYPDGASPSGWIHYEPSLYDEDTIRVFRTYVLSDIDQSFSVHLGGDDGHSIYVDGAFLGGGGFGVPVEPTIHLTAGVITEIELLGYNGPGPWQLVFNHQDGREFSGTPGVRINALGEFQTVPEPSSTLLLVIGTLILTLRFQTRIRASFE